MSCYIIDSEHDMERAIKYTIQLTQEVQGAKRVTFSFPSDQLSDIFLTNLALSFVQAGIPLQNDLEVDILVPGDTDLFDDTGDDDGLDSV